MCGLEVFKFECPFFHILSCVFFRGFCTLLTIGQWRSFNSVRIPIGGHRNFPYCSIFDCKSLVTVQVKWKRKRKRNFSVLISQYVFVFSFPIKMRDINDLLMTMYCTGIMIESGTSLRDITGAHNNEGRTLYFSS